ncbi:MAG: DUF2071 domain-containing protein [Myxococcota bacterium]
MNAPAIDRLTPCNRPDRAAAGHQKWRTLLFLHWPIPADALRPLIPSGLSIDTHDGVAYIGVVPFAREGVQPWWMPFGMDFLECNVRTYVHINGEPGVWFFSLEAASWLAVQAARIGWSLPYHFAEMGAHTDGSQRHYHTTRRGQPDARLSARYTVGAPLGALPPASLEFFLMERYLLFSQRNGALYRGQVYHTPYPAHAATLHELDEGLIAAAGLPAPVGPPPLVHYAPGVDVDVFSLTRI